MGTTVKVVSSHEIFQTIKILDFLHAILKQKTTIKRIIEAEINLQCKSDIMPQKILFYSVALSHITRAHSCVVSVT